MTKSNLCHDGQGRDGVTFYLLKGSENAIGDIDVAPGCTKVSFRGFRAVYLREVPKTFPDVEELVIPVGCHVLRLSNFMFPNVKRVTSFSNSFQSGPVLVRNRELLNTFCKKEDEVIDLTGVNMIGQRAFAGCMSRKVINADGVYGLSRDAFTESAFEITDMRYARVGQVLVRGEGEELELDDESCSIYTVWRPEKITAKKIITHNAESVQRLTFIRSLREIEVRDDKATFLKDWKSPVPVIINSDFYKTVDGVIYTADMKELVHCPESKRGDFVIPEGVEAISAYAFLRTGLRSVKIPDSMRVIQEYAFSAGSISSVDLGNGVRTLGNSAFHLCLNLTELTLPDSLETIDGFLPQNLRRIRSNGVPHGLVDSIFNMACPVMELFLKNDVFYLPRNAVVKDRDVEFLTRVLSLCPSEYRAERFLELVKDKNKYLDTAFLLYEKTGEPREFVRKNARRFSGTCVKKKDEETLVKVLRWGFLSKRSLRCLLSKVQDADMVAATAVILELLGEKSPTVSFRI